MNAFGYHASKLLLLRAGSTAAAATGSSGTVNLQKAITTSAVARGTLAETRYVGVCLYGQRRVVVKRRSEGGKKKKKNTRKRHVRLDLCVIHSVMHVIRRQEY